MDKIFTAVSMLLDAENPNSALAELLDSNLSTNEKVKVLLIFMSMLLTTPEKSTLTTNNKFEPLFKGFIKTFTPIMVKKEDLQKI